MQYDLLTFQFKS